MVATEPKEASAKGQEILDAFSALGLAVAPSSLELVANEYFGTEEVASFEPDGSRGARWSFAVVPKLRALGMALDAMGTTRAM
eukprot:3407793-Lingulodinium_polyedra.AAC.1